MNPYLMSVVSEWWYGVKEEEREELNTKLRKVEKNVRNTIRKEFWT